MLRTGLLILIIVSTSFFAQDTTSSVIKKKGPIRFLPQPKIKILPKQYSLLAGYSLVQEANSGNLYAQHELGLRYLNGWGFPTDTLKAVEWIGKAASKNLIPAKFNLGIMYYNGIGVNWNPFEAYESFKYTAYKGYPGGQVALGIFYLSDFVVNRDLDTAYKWIKFAADAENEQAAEIIKSMTESGYTPLDSNLTNDIVIDSTSFEGMTDNTKWDIDMFNFDDIEEPDSVESKISRVLASSPEKLKKVLNLNVVKDSLELKDSSNIGLVKYAVQSDSPEALLILGKACEVGNLVKKDEILAMVHYIKAYRFGSRSASKFIAKLFQEPDFAGKLDLEIKKDNPDAMFARAGLIATGFDYSLFPVDALNLLEKAVEYDHINSMIELGLLYYSGNLVKEDKEKALEFWERAAAKGSLEAEIRIANANIQNRNSNTNLAVEIGILYDAVNKGDMLAETALARCYENGIHVKMDKAKAAALYWKAMRRGNYAAYISLEKMHDQIRPKKDLFKIYE